MLKYNVSGSTSDKTIIFINGAGVGAWMWQSQVDYLKAYKTITFDLPGHGDNSNIDFTSINQCVLEIKSIIKKECKGSDVVLVGHSIGAQICMRMLEKLDENIKHLVIVSGLNHPMPKLVGLTKSMVGWTMPLVSQRWFSKLQSSSLDIPESLFNLYYEDSLKLSKNSLTNILVENMLFELKEKITCSAKVLILVGSGEKKIMLDSARKTLRYVEDSVAFEILGAGHGIPYSHTGVFNKTLYSFINNESIQHDPHELRLIL